MLPLGDNIPRLRLPVATWFLIFLNGLVFYAEVSLPPGYAQRVIDAFGVVPVRLTHFHWPGDAAVLIPTYGSLLTSMFLHGGWLHLIGNMWTLWIFGDNVEDRIGPIGFLAFYLLCGLGAGAVHILANPDSTVPTIGASGAIAGVMGAYLALFPRARIIVLVPVLFWPLLFDMSAVLFLVYWFTLQVLGGTMTMHVLPGAGGIAWWAHIGGFVAGFVLVWLFVAPSHGYRRPMADESVFERSWTR